MLSFTESYGPIQYVADGKYIVYSVKDTYVDYSAKSDNPSLYNAEYGTVYDYDVARNVFDPNLGEKVKDTATSINTLLDPKIAKEEYTRYVTEQTKNGFSVDSMNFMFLSMSAIQAYKLSQQDETLLGIDIQEFYDMERTLGANQYYTVDADGNLGTLDFAPREEDKTSWLDRLTGVALAAITICVGIIIVGALQFVPCGVATAVAPYIMGAFVGAGIEIFMQSVIQGNKISDINWLRVGIAAVSGVLSATPGLGWMAAGLIQGATEFAMTFADGGSLKDSLIAFGVGVATGILIQGVTKGLSKIKFCFVAGTPVLMAGGYTKAIEGVRAGDMVKSYDEATGKVENKRVLSTSVNETNEVIKITTNSGDEIVATPGHPFYANGGWVDAKDLRAGDILVNVNGEKVVVEQVSHEILESSVKVYNFEVADNHTYLVGNDGGVIVHNAKCKKVGDHQLNAKKPEQIHHFLTNKNKQFTPQFEEIVKKYDLNLDGAWNKELMEHLGRHPNKYHMYMMDEITSIAKKAETQADFLNQFSLLKEHVKSIPEMLTKAFWKK